VTGGEIREFPHNIVLEVFLEGGWFAGLYFTYLMWRGLKGVYLLGKKGELAWAYRLLFCFTVFSLLNDLVSGELNDSKVLLAFLGLSVGLAGYSKEKAPVQSGWASAPPKGTLLTQDGSS
jgi:hypothetical protein